MDILKQQLEQALSHLPFYTLTVVDEIDSTNRVVKQWGKEGKPQGAVLIARSQTAGRGRLGRSFYSPDSGIYISILLRPDLSPKDTLRLTTGAAVAVARAIGDCAQIKWVNDVFVKDKKVCGILTESALSGDKLDYAVVGIGLNLCEPQGGFPHEIRHIAGGIFDTLPAEEQIARLVADLLTEFYQINQDLFDPALPVEYRKRNYLLGKQVTANGTCGVVTDVREDFALLLRDEAGQIHAVTAGEATIGS